MYTLTLTADERGDFDWMGYRSNAGEMSNLLIDCITDDCEWSSKDAITFQIPEHVAWEINSLAESEDCAWPCLGPEIARKMQRFVDSIV